MHLNFKINKKKLTLIIIIILSLIFLVFLFLFFNFKKQTIEDPSEAFSLAHFKNNVEITEVNKDIIKVIDLSDKKEWLYLWNTDTSYVCLENPTIKGKPIDLLKDNVSFFFNSDLKGLTYGKDGLTKIKKDIVFGKQATIYWSKQDKYRKQYREAEAIMLISTKCDF